MQETGRNEAMLFWAAPGELSMDFFNYILAAIFAAAFAVIAVMILADEMRAVL